MHVQPYLCFEGTCEKAIAFYQQALNAEVVMMMRFSDGPAPAEGDAGCAGGAPAPGDKIMHAHLRVGPTDLMMSDGMCAGTAEFKGITLAINLENDQQVQETFAKISEGGTVLVAPHKTFFASLWGVCADKFGVNWMVLSPAPVPVASA